ncbi:type VI secretion system baseplate subunit TssK [Desulfatiglans anilini]|uniref:type VI secretion system baseplate subunit TssK n=1 Tax=Desulfatiglans anilini TaxID=90728 RepID=UPI0004807BFA|nr:type VI secretion system baseplate subunit TssK [Desulfatiglans anilini]
MDRPLFWHQGLFLQPQHFQLADRHAGTLLQPFHRFLQPDFWGVGDIEIAEAALGNLTFELTRGEFIFPDRTHAVFPGNALIEGRSFEEAWVNGGKPLTVYVGLRQWNESGENVTVLPRIDRLSEITTRFTAPVDPDEIQDLHQQGPAGQVKRLHYVLRIFWEPEISRLGGYALVPVARLERRAEKVVLDEGFFPPCLTVTACAPLLATVREIRDQLAARGRQLEAYKRDRGIHSAEFGARDMVYLLALRSLNRYVPLLFHLTEAEPVHPWQVYALLRQLVGELSSFSGEINAMGEGPGGARLLPPYDHRNLGPCFSAARSLITRLLDEITAGPEYVLQVLFDGTYFAAELPPAIFEGRMRYYLVFETEADPQTVLRSLETAAKTGSRETLPILIARALPGVRLAHLPAPPQELPRRARALYFQIDHHSDQWLPVQKNRNLALYWDQAPEDLKIELMVTGRR